ncbi:hypothetical protein IFO69_19080 [Echinicola sp. CAU 1574]|uniref:Universal stress protein n=1 Tax=Echinicola arenosa TaxID=2774144 RepID=A0ABR9ATC4_9BACT|nr:MULTISPECIES: hypothetical protein [Echinicola]MBD8490864.1 hypothetical protein [Echinicola arenosa]
MKTKTILIPTDFSVKSLNIVKSALSINDDCELEILLVHGIYLPDSMTDLLLFSKKKLLQDLETAEFRASCQMIASKYESRLLELSLDIFSGYNQSAFENYLEANQIDEIYAPTDHAFKPRHKNSFDMMPFIHRSTTNLVKVKRMEVGENFRQERNELSGLFFSELSSL